MSQIAVDTIYIEENGDFIIRWADGHVDKGSRGKGIFMIQGVELRVLVSAQTIPVESE